MRILLSLLLAASAASLFAADNWPEYRGPTADGHAAAKSLPVEWSETKNVVWKTKVHDKGWASPVVWGKQIWMTTALADGKELFAVCVDFDSGRIVHDVKVFDVEKPFFCIPFNSYASPTPAVEEGRVYVHFGSAGTACLDTGTGKVLWERRDLPCDHFRAAGSSPILHDNLLILTFDGYDQQYLAALDKSNGKTVWKKDRNTAWEIANPDLHKAYSTPAVIKVKGKPQLISPSAQVTVAYDPATGDELWRVNHGGMNAAARPIYAFDHVFLTHLRPQRPARRRAARRPGRRDEVARRLDLRQGRAHAAVAAACRRIALLHLR
jgi:outer membrane protein assembly factor BamB